VVSLKICNLHKMRT